jgi:hypothetical protein
MERDGLGVLLIGTLTGALIIAAITAVGRILKELASRNRQTRSNIPPVSVARSVDGNPITEAERSAA